MKSTRERILDVLHSNPRSSINDLAEAVGINAISVRHHLNNLEADGLIQYDEERHGVGRPRLVYSLTERGVERYPTRYLQLTDRLLDQLKEALPQEAINRIFTQMAAKLAAAHRKKAEHLPLEGRIKLLQEILAQEGFEVEWEADGDHYHIREITCPYYHIGHSHPEVCTIDQTLISTILDIPAEKIQCVLSGDRHCTFLIPRPQPKENPL
ncbi:MAG TPA: winged helix-turn-helix transcriptional regulator [Anaerolineaceae bacterium]|jgi:predicted ArsR family transcriptional regulator|nr:winged helix-turn-helix transcriptional regulator [Longilinea sp.]HNZ00787.1 winged helix-turn-helix transcriptional regulator [Anaerolineaceae bacterium]HOH19397.1 winged helix-turn-helix transcriptional regulator [Anaerolineaceae bacterium]HOU43829.1 winged helix-turn-helix transcriptional regulator [Anaerolineaceae bacterium]HPA32243.1 winged helix-turn-helix transcriptional regulator [Anaerolineaceae bacterium]